MTTTTAHCWHCGAMQATAGQLAVWRLLADPRELTIAEIAVELGRPLPTIKNRSSALYTALGVRGRQGAATKFRELAGAP